MPYVTSCHDPPALVDSGHVVHDDAELIFFKEQGQCPAIIWYMKLESAADQIAGASRADLQVMLKRAALLLRNVGGLSLESRTAIGPAFQGWG